MSNTLEKFAKKMDLNFSNSKVCLQSVMVRIIIYGVSMMRSLMLFLFTFLIVSMANEASPVPGGARDGGRDIVTIEAYSLDETGSHILLDSTTVEVPSAGMSAYYAMKRSTIKFESTELVRWYEWQRLLLAFTLSNAAPTTSGT